MAGVSLQERGWHLSAEGIAQCTSDGRSDAESIIKVALNTDLREIGEGWLPEELNRGKADCLKGPGVLQLQKIRNIAAPKDNEESQFAPRLMKLVLTDGHTTCTAVETEVLRDVGSNTGPGTKILLKQTTEVEHGFLLLNNKNTKYLGGRVEKLAEGWELKKKLAKQQRSTFGSDGGPPPFVPFGQKLGNDTLKPSTRRDNFKSLETNKAEKKLEDKEFEQQRQATIAEALQAKEDAQSKKFGGGQKQISTDHDIARITEMGFKAEEATLALKQNNGNVQQAIESLLKGDGPSGPRDRRPQGGPNRQGNFDSGDKRGQGRDFGGPNRQSSYESDRGKGRKDRRDDDSSAGPRGRRGRNEEDAGEVSSKPSGPATLFDFLAVSNKIPEAKEKPDKGTAGKAADYSKNNYDSNERSRNTSGGSDRSKQTVPPRFVNKSKNEQGQGRGQGRFQDNRSQRSRDDRPYTAPAESRKYDNSNQGDRGQGDRNQGDRNRNYNEKDRNYSDRNRNYNDRDRNYNDRSKPFSDKNYSDNRGGGGSDRNYNDTKGGGGSDRNYDDTRGSGGSDRNYNNNNRGGGANDRNYNNSRGSGGNERNFNGTRGGGAMDRNYKDTRGVVGKGNDRNFKQSGRGGENGNSKSNTDVSQRQNEDRISAKDNPKLESTGNKAPDKPSNSEKSPRDTNGNKSASARTSVNDGKDQGQGRSHNNQSQGQSSQVQSETRQKQSSAGANSYKQDSYSKGGNVQKSQTSYSNAPNNMQMYSVSNNFVPSQPIPSSNYGGYNSYPPLSTNAQFQPTEFIYTEAQAPIQFSIKVGDKVMAKYWEDNLFYEAKIEVMTPNMPTVIVNFEEYGNMEEVLITDIRPYIPQMVGAYMTQQAPMIPADMTVPPPQVFYSGPPPVVPAGMDEVIQAFGTMEFRRGGGGAAYQRKDTRGQQQFYQPPAQRR